MGLYSEQDIGFTLSGDLITSYQGDLYLNNSLDTYKSVVNFLVRTDYGDYAPNTYIGCNLGSYIGNVNSQDTHQKMTNSINYSLSKIFDKNDYRVTVVPFDINEAVGFVHVAGTYLVDNEYRNFEQERITFFFPYIDGKAIQAI